MRIVIATPLYPPEIGGPATYAKLLYDGLPEKGIEVELVKFSEIRHLPKIFRHYVYYRRVLRAARNADAILALDPVSTGLPAMRAAKKAGKPFVVKIVGDYAWEQGQQRFGITQNLDEFVNTKKVPFPVRVLRRIQTRVARSATLVIVPSEYLKGIVVKWGIQSDKIQVISNAVAIGILGSVPEVIAGLRRPLIVSVGRLVPWKHMDGVIDAVALLRRGSEGFTPIHASLAIVGDGPDRGSLITHAEKNLQGNCIFTGALSHSDTLATMKSADVFVLNSSYEGLSHLLIEACMLGVPIVATRVGGNEEVITSEKEGVLVHYEDKSALAEALARILRGSKSQSPEHQEESARRFSTETMLSSVATAILRI